MAASHKDWELPNSRIWLAEMDIESGRDFLFSKSLIIHQVKTQENHKREGGLGTRSLLA